MFNESLVTPAEAKAVWNAMERPSSHKVAAAFTAAGRKVSYATISRWRKAGWPARGPMARVRSRVDVAVPVLTGDPVDTAVALPPIEDIAGITDGDLVRRTCREGLDAARRIFHQVRHDPRLIAAKPREIATLVGATGALVLTCTEALGRRPAIAEAEMKDIGGTEQEYYWTPENDPLAPAYEAWGKARRQAEARQEKEAAGLPCNSAS